MAIHSESQQLADMGAFLRQEYNLDLPAAPDQLDFAYYWTGQGEGDNEHYYRAPDCFPFIPGSQLDKEIPVAVHKDTIQASGRTIMELQTHDLSPPLSL